MIKFGEWLPDQPTHEKGGATDALNVYSAKDSYLPLKSFSPLSSSLAERARSARAFKASTGTVYTYAGTETKLYSISSSPTDVSKAGGYSSGTEDIWEFAKWGEKCIATNYVDNIQSITFGGMNFADLGGTPPKARTVAVVGSFIVIGYINDTVDGVIPYRVQWSGFEDETGWTPGTNQSDFQDLLGSGGAIKKIIGGDYGIIFQEKSIQRMDYVGTPLVFQFNEVEPEKGALSQGGIVQYGRQVFYIGVDGFYALIDGSQSVSIGSEKVNRYFLNDLEQNYSYRITSAIDPVNNLVYWSYPGAGNSGGQPNKMIIYNWVTKNWSRAEIEVSSLYRGLSSGYTLEQLDSFGTMDTLPFSLDSPAWQGGVTTLSAFDTSFRQGSFDGADMTATIETDEFGGEHRTKFNEVWPYVEGAGTITVQVGTRNSLNNNPIWSSAVNVSSSGKASIRSNAKYQRIRINISGGFSHAKGIDVNLKSAGRK